MPKTLITFKDFKMSQSNKVLLDNVNLSIHQFDRIVLVGENGCGKSSLLNLFKNNLASDNLTFSPPERVELLCVDFFSPNRNFLKYDKTCILSPMKST